VLRYTNALNIIEILNTDVLSSNNFDSSPLLYIRCVAAAAVLTASQCFNSQSRIPKVMFGCASPGHMIKVLRAFHGVRAAGDDDVMRSRQCDDVSGDPLCSYCPGDCVDDSINEVSASAGHC